MISKHYFHVQKITFAGVGIDVMSKTQKQLVKYPIILYGLMTFSCFHLIIVAHYAYVHMSDFVEITDSFPLLCQLFLSICKMLLFLKKGKHILRLIWKIHKLNLKALNEEFTIVVEKNNKDSLLSTFYLRLVIFTGSSGLMHPVLNAIYVYFTHDKIILDPPNKGTYFWDFSQLSGYSLVYFLNVFTVYYVCVVSLAIDTLFSWFVSNVVAQFHIIGYRFERAALKCATYRLPTDLERLIEPIILYHRRTLQLGEKLNRVYGEIVFIQFTIVCTEICSLVFRVSRPSDSAGVIAYKCLFLCAVALQLIVYCYNGQRIRDESFQVATAVYCAFDWSYLDTSYKKLLLLTMMRSQKSINIKCIFFEVDLTLYLWVFKTASSLLTALKTLEENQD